MCFFFKENLITIFKMMVKGPFITLCARNFLNPDPIITTEHDSDSNGITGTWCSIKAGIPINKQDWDEAYQLATEGDFKIL